jgi:PAS domain S-box-containing protein
MTGTRDGGGHLLAPLRPLLDGVPAAVAYLAGRELIYEYANEEYRQLVGGRDLLGQPVRAALPELPRQCFAVLDEVLDSGQPRRGHEAAVRLRRHGKLDQIFINYAVQPVRDDRGVAAGLLIYNVDVTAAVRDRRGAEAAAGVAGSDTAVADGAAPGALSASSADAAVADAAAGGQERFRTLFETLPHGIVHYAADGQVIGMNQAARDMLGPDVAAALSGVPPPGWDAVHEDGTPFPAEQFPVAAALRTGTMVGEVALGVPSGPGQPLRWLAITAVPDVLDEAGQPQRAYAIFRDLSTQHGVAGTLRGSAELIGRLREANVLGVMLAGEDQVYDANDAFLDLIGYTRDDVDAGRVSYQNVTPEDWADSDAEAQRQLRQTGAIRPYEKEYVHRDGHRVPVLVGAALASRQPMRWVTYVVDLSARQQAEEERAALLSRERAALAEAERAREQLGFLLRAGDLVAAAQDRNELLYQVSCQMVRSLADYCLVFLPTRDGALQASSLAHRDPAGEIAYVDLRDEPVPSFGQLTVQAAYAAGTSTLIRDVAAQLARRGEPNPLVRDVWTRLKPEKALVTPLMAGQRAMGVLTIGRSASRLAFTEADVAVVEELGRRMAVGLANADTFARDHTVAETLQHSVLPDSLPDIPGLDLAVRYIPGADGVEVGGDWYDAFPLGDQLVGLAVGDVVGHSITSASIMAQVRNLLRAYAVDTIQPADVLHRTNTAMARLLPDAMATVVYGVLDPATGEFSYANAGHPAPVYAAAPGQVEWLETSSGPMLGIPGEGSFSTGQRRLAPGSGLLLYTDGLIEDRRRDITEGFTALADAMGPSASRSAEQTCTAVQAALLGSASRADDVCLLAARLTG